MEYKTVDQSLIQRQAESPKYNGKLVIKSKDIHPHVSPQGRNATVLDATAGLPAKTLMLTEVHRGSQCGLHKTLMSHLGISGLVQQEGAGKAPLTK